MEIEPEVDLFSGGSVVVVYHCGTAYLLTLASDVDERRENSGKWSCQSHDWAKQQLMKNRRAIISTDDYTLLQILNYLFDLLKRAFFDMQVIMLSSRTFRIFYVSVPLPR